MEQYFKAVKVLAKFFGGNRIDGDPDLDQLLKLDDLWENKYQENRLESFSQAKLIANELVISNVIRPCPPPDEGANEDIDRVELANIILKYNDSGETSPNRLARLIEQYYKNRASLHNEKLAIEFNEWIFMNKLLSKVSYTPHDNKWLFEIEKYNWKTFTTSELLAIFKQQSGKQP